MSMTWPDLQPTLSGARRPPDGSHGVYEQIAGAAARHSAELAVVHGEAAVTYEELMERVLEARRRFESLGIRPNSAIVVQLPRGIEHIVTVLATLAHACHFVPVAEGEPEGRVAEIAGRVHAAAHVRTSASGRAVVARLGGTGPSQPTSRLAYILHTSGSTGRPKGAALSTAALGNLLSWYGEQLSLSPDARYAQLSRPSFDFSLPEILLPLLHGARVVIPPRPMDSGLIPVTEYLIEQGATTLQLVPTLLRPFVNLLKSVPSMVDRLDSVTTIVCNGEALPDPLRQEVARVLPGATLVNSYGPTEACVAVTWHRCSQRQETLPDIIGAPMPNVDLYVLDDDLKPVPAGATGELWIGGVQVADGYVGAPAETLRSFLVRSGSGGEPQTASRVYRTGDLVRALDDGNLEFVGRRDRQVQLRGVRVEIGEIEAAVRGTGLCGECRVTAVPGPVGSTADALECFVTPATVETDELEQTVRSRLPRDRWPRRFHALTTLPATENGKVDEAALLALVQRSGPRADPAVGPRAHDTQGARTTPVDASAEEVLRQVLAKLIGRLPAGDEPMRSMGLDSLEYLELQVAAADRGYVLPTDLWTEGPATVGEVATGMDRTDRAAGASAAADRTGTDPVVLRDELRRVFDQACEDDTEILVVQSSLPDFKNVVLHDALSMLLSEIDRVSRRITVALPAYTLSFLGTGQVDLTSAPSESGMAATHVRKAIGGRRTRHPVYSFVVAGPDAKAIADVDWSERSAFGDDSVFGWFSARKTKYVLLGTRAYAQVHRSEQLARVPYMSHVHVEGEITDDTGTRQGGCSVYARDVPGSREARALGVCTDSILELGGRAVSTWDLTMCEATVIDVREFEAVVVPTLRRRPYALLQPDLLDPAKALVKERELQERAGDQAGRRKDVTQGEE